MTAHQPNRARFLVLRTGRRAVPAAVTLVWLGVAALAGIVASARAQPQTIQVEIESVTVEPSTREANILVRRHFPLKVGQVVDPDQLVQVRDQLAATGLFSEVDIYTKPGSRPGLVGMVVAATPSHRFRIETGLGFQPLFGWYLDIFGVRRTGLFDRGGTARVSWRTGLRRSGLFGELTVPGLLPNDFDLLFNADLIDETWTAYDGDQSYYQDVGRSHILLGAARRIRPETEFEFRTGYSTADPGDKLDTYDDDPSIPAGALLPVYDGRLHFFDLEGKVHRNRLDRLVPWRSGTWAGLALRGAESSRGPFFWGAEIDLRAMQPIAATSAAAFRFRGVYTDPGTPYFLRPVVGGTNSLRGFPAGSLSGPLGARALWQVSAEWRHPLVGSDARRPAFMGTVFADAGDHWDATGDRFGLSASVGYGMLIRIPWIDTVNVEVAYPLTEDPTESPVTIGLSLGRSF